MHYLELQIVQLGKFHEYTWCKSWPQGISFATKNAVRYKFYSPDIGQHW